MAVWGQLGPIVFERLKTPTGYEHEWPWRWEEHNIAGEKDRIQFTGIPLERLTLGIRFHVTFCDPERELENLKEAANSLEPLPLLTGEGYYLGDFVIENIRQRRTVTGKHGEIVDAHVEMRLREFQ